MAENTSTNTIDAYTQFENWLGEQPCWIQDATYRIYHGLEVDDVQIAKYADMCISQAKNEKTDYKQLKPNESKGQLSSSCLAVLKLSNIVGVNALAPEASLEFSRDGVTVVYGLNGAGKSGFMRVFKQLSGSPFNEPIQPNVFSKENSAKPSCTFLISQDGQEKEITCDLSSNVKGSPLSSCDVFDTRISNAYITKTNNVSYQPFVFTVLSELANIAGRISKHIDRRIGAIPTETITLPDDISGRDEIDWIRRLSADTVFPVEYSVWSEDQQKTYEDTSKKLDIGKVTSDLHLCKAHLSSIIPILEDLIAAEDLIKSEELAAAYNTYIETKRKLDTAQLVFKETADDFDKISVSIADWKDLWRIAQRYYESTVCVDGKGHFGEKGTICPLCHQVITGETASRFKSVNAYVNGTCSEDFNTAVNDLKKLIKAIVSRSYSPSSSNSQLSNIIDESDLSIITAVYESLERTAALDDIEAEYANIAKLNTSEALALLLKKNKELETQLGSLEQALKDEGRTALQEKLATLTCHKWIYDNSEQIERVISNLKEKQVLLSTKPFLTTNRITHETNSLASALITDAYIKRFTRELQKLAPRIKVKLDKAPSQKGSTPYKVTIDTDSGIRCKPEDILSEGEQRIVALAAFFADATGRESKTPLIIDDPISSLDLLYEEKATDEIVRLASERQIIVFTHRISLLVGMEEACKNAGIPFSNHHIRSTRKGNGLPDFEDVYTGDVKAQLNGLIAVASKIEKADPDSREYDDALWRAYQTFRKCVERSVEDLLLLGMVRRFDRRIMTNGKVLKLPLLSPEDVRIIDDMMTKYSFAEHSQPIDSPPIQIDTSELKTDIQMMLSWIKSYNKKMNSPTPKNN